MARSSRVLLVARSVDRLQRRGGGTLRTRERGGSRRDYLLIQLRLRTPPHTLRRSLASRPIRGGHRWVEGPKIKVGRTGGRCSCHVPPGDEPAAQGRRPREPICRGRGAGVGKRARRGRGRARPGGAPRGGHARGGGRVEDRDEPAAQARPGWRIETSLRRKGVRGGGSRRACGAKAVRGGGSRRACGAPVCLRQEGAAGAGGAAERRQQWNSRARAWMGQDGECRGGGTIRSRERGGSRRDFL